MSLVPSLSKNSGIVRLRDGSKIAASSLNSTIKKVEKLSKDDKGLFEALVGRCQTGVAFRPLVPINPKSGKVLDWKQMFMRQELSDGYGEIYEDIKQVVRNMFEMQEDGTIKRVDPFSPPEVTWV